MGVTIDRKKFAYACIFGSGAATLTSAGVGEKNLQFTTNGLSSNCTADAGNNKITIVQTGVYLALCQFSFVGTNGYVYTGKLKADGADETGDLTGTSSYVAATADGTRDHSCSCQAIAKLTAGQDIEFWAECDTNTGTFNCTYLSLQVTQL